jgi:hypothetical protein
MDIKKVRDNIDASTTILNRMNAPFDSIEYSHTVFLRQILANQIVLLRLLAGEGIE